MTWPFLIAVTIASAVITALLNCIPILENTSFSAPAETLEAWVVLAVYIIINCKSRKESIIKTFVFFLLSQPLIYLLEVPFKDDGWALFGYYPFWGIITLLTIPGAAVAYRVKNGDILSAVILSVANGLVIISGMSRISMLVNEFPRYIITLIFCLVFPFVFIFRLLSERKSRIVALILAAVMIITGLCMFVFFQQDSSTSYPLEEGNWSVESVSGKGLEVTVKDEELEISSHTNGDYTFVLISDDGKEIYYNVLVEGGNHSISVSKSNEGGKQHNGTDTAERTQYDFKKRSSFFSEKALEQRKSQLSGLRERA